MKNGKSTVFLNGTIIAHDRLIEDAVLVCRNGKIAGIKQADMALPPEAEIVDAKGGYISPGFVDLHVHGGAGADFMDGTVESVETACRAHSRHGTTTIFPTTTTGSSEQILSMLAACKQVMQSDAQSTIAGVHLYGPFFAADKVGCHSAAGRRSPTATEYKRYFDSGLVAIATCAAELDGASGFYRAAAKAGCLITCGHSNASWAEMQRAFDAGMRHVDHFWCAMSSVPSLRQRLGVPMQASMAEFVLMNRDMSTEVIADGCHLSHELLEFAYRMLGPERLCLVTDCNRALDLPAGEYRFGNQSDGTCFYSDGKVGWSADRSSLASSVVGMDQMVRVMREATTASLPEVIRMASLTPATRVGLDRHLGSLQRGKLANVLVLSRKLKVQQVFVRERRIH
ncbi:MAG: N-acetylglucosamine-6-phosphate deacetylase [Pirellulaceae bacterium]|nr:N-acetylglucosamine-6-phosphate deacetylase [Pirellulaceae bacterium]